jgi:hypothetical protein
VAARVPQTETAFGRTANLRRASIDRFAGAKLNE